jgi:8-oxo-dGTP pyrophosphatase MutT (NUDIX family)
MDPGVDSRRARVYPRMDGRDGAMAGRKGKKKATGRAVTRPPDAPVAAVPDRGGPEEPGGPGPANRDDRMPPTEAGRGDSPVAAAGAARTVSSGKGKRRKPKVRALRRQIGALPYRIMPDGRMQVLILTSRETRRFNIPKGWPIKKKKKSEVAAIEAYEEAGVRGTVGRKPIGRYTYWKRLKDTFTLIRVVVYPLEVREDLSDWPERAQRQYSWLSPSDAAILVDEPGLARILREFG